MGPSYKKRRQSDHSRPISPALLALLHSVVQRCCTTNSEHFLVVQDIIDALSHQEMKETEDISEELITAGTETGSEPRGGPVCDSCYRICELRRILFSVYCIAIESLLMNTDLATERLSEDAIRRSSSLFSISERVPNSSTSTPKHKSQSNNSTESGNYKVKIPESEITARLSLIIRNAIARIQYQGQCFDNFDYWPKFRFLAKISILGKNFAFLAKFRLLAKISILGQNFGYWPKFRFLAKISILAKFRFLLKFRFFTKISIFTNILIVCQNFGSWPKFRLAKISILPQNFDFNFQLKFRCLIKFDQNS